MSQSTKIGYLIPEFPGQTHNFFWRERQALTAIGIDTSLISTRKPPKSIVSPSWAEAAKLETSYLFPISLPDLLNSLRILISTSPKAWLDCLQIIHKNSELSLKQKIQLVILIPFAAKLIWLSQVQGWKHIHVHSCAMAANIAMFASILSKLTYSLTLHNPLSVYGPNQKAKWSHAKFAIVITNKIYQEIIRDLAGYLPPKIAISPMGVDCSRFERHSLYSAYTGVGELILFSCGRLNPCKGYLYLIQAVKLLRNSGIDVKLKIAGEDEKGGNGYRKDIEKLIDSEGLASVISLLGAVPEEVVIEYLNQAHIFVLASLEEPLGVAIMEAMAMQVPVIATHAGGVMELINHERDGILVPPKDADAIKSAILRLIGDPELAMNISYRSREKIITTFNYQHSAQTIADMLRSSDA